MVKHRPGKIEKSLSKHVFFATREDEGINSSITMRDSRCGTESGLLRDVSFLIFFLIPIFEKSFKDRPNTIRKLVPNNNFLEKNLG